MMTYIWIEGERAMREFCKRRFGDTPKMLESYGTVGTAKVYNASKEKYNDDGTFSHCADMFLLYMPVSDNDAMTRKIPNLVTSTELHDKIKRMSYDEIRADKSSIILPRR